MNNFFQGIKLKLTSSYKGWKTMNLMIRGRSDHKRWADRSNLHSAWDSRTKLIASLIAENSSILEFGAGTMALKNFLPPSCLYTPSDIIDRGNGTIVCDLNEINLPNFEFHDVVVFSGVLEYIFDVDRLLSHLSVSCRTIIASYAVTDFPVQRTAFQRRKHGWVNDFSKSEFEAVFANRGFVCETTMQWKDQVIYKFLIDS